MPKSVIDLILKQIDSVNLEDITRITNESIEHFDKILEKDKIDIEIEFENIVETIRKKVETYCITKFVNSIEPFLERVSSSSLNIINGLEDELSFLVVEDIRESGIPIFADSYLSKNKDIFKEFIKNKLEITNLKIIFKNYFIAYKVTDIFQEINEIIKTSKVKDNTEFYLNIGEIVYNKTVFPICFFR